MSQTAEKTLQKVSDEFLAEVLAILQDGRDQSLARVEAIRRETADAVSKTLEASLKQAESLKRQLIGTAELESRNLQLKAVEAAVNEVFGEAIKRSSGLPSEQYEESLANLVSEGVSVIGHTATVSCNASDKRAVSSVIRKLNKEGAKLTLNQNSITTVAGVMLTSHDGTIRFDNTIETRLERMRQVLRKEIASILVGGSSNTRTGAGLLASV